MDWTGEFLTYATVGASIVRTLDAECDHTLRMVEHLPALTNAMIPILKSGPIYGQMPQDQPLCIVCERSFNGKIHWL